MKQFSLRAPDRRLVASTARNLLSGVAVAALLAASLAHLSAQVAPGRNVNMVSGTTWPDGDPFLQRQNEPSIAVSSRNRLHLLAGANDYRTVDLPGLPADRPTGDAWLGVFKSFDGGKTWTSTLIPGYPQDTSPLGASSPLKAYDAAADPVVRAGANGMIVYAGIAFERAAPISAAPVQAAVDETTDRGGRRSKRTQKARAAKAKKRAHRKAAEPKSRGAEKQAGTGGTKSAVFASIFLDLNNRENGDTMPLVRTVLVDSDPGARFLDKPWLAVDVPRPGAPTCTFSVPQPNGTNVDQSFAAGKIYMLYTAFTGSGSTLRGQILFTSSSDCGATWSRPKDLSTVPDPDLDDDGVVTSADQNIVKASYGKRCGDAGFNVVADINKDCLVNIVDLSFVSRNVGKTWTTDVRVPQGGTIAIDPLTGSVNVAWREFKAGTLPNVIRFARSTDGGASFTTPSTVATFNPFDQGTTETSFRSSAFPTMVHDGARLYLAYSARGFASARPDPVTGDARILLHTSPDGTTWSGPYVADDSGLPGHQMMPALAFGGGTLWLLHYDLRRDESQVFGPFVDELAILTSPLPRPPRHTLDVRIAQASPAVNPSFTSTQLSEYAVGVLAGSTTPVQLQFNPPNLPLFRQGQVPFIGDYVDLITSPTMRPNGDGTWSFNIEPGSTDGGGHAVWTENRNVKIAHAVQDPATGFISVPGYTPPNSASRGSMSLFDPTSPLPACDPLYTGTRNQDVYTARFDQGLFAVALGNAKPLGNIQRAFALLVENGTRQIRSYRLTILNQPPGGSASFLQFSPMGSPRVVLDVSIPPLSTVARNAYVSSSDPDARVTIDVSEIAAPGDPNTLPGGRHGTIVLNPDPSNPAIDNPAIDNPALANTSILDEEVYAAKITPAIDNPAIDNPAIDNPAIDNPAIDNVTPANPTIVNPAIDNPAIDNPAIDNAAISNPAIDNPAIDNSALADASITDTTWELKNDGNAAVAYSVKLLLNGTSIPPGFRTQLVIHKSYTTPAAASNCQLKVQLHNEVLVNITDPAYTTAANVGNPAIDNPAIDNATVALAPGDVVNVTLRVFDPNRFDLVTFNAAASVTAAAVPQAVDTIPAQQGVTQPTPAIALTITTPRLNDYVLGSGPYAQQLTANAAGGWDIIAGQLPPGLTLNGTGAIFGTPTTVGTYTFTVLFVSAADPTQTLTRQFTIRVGDPLVIVTNTLANGLLGSPYADQMVVTGGVGALRYLVYEGSLPPGVVLDPASGALAGTPKATGTFNFIIRVEDSGVPQSVVRKSYAVTISAAGPTDVGITAISATPTSVPVGYTYLSFNAVVANLGASLADNVQVAWTLPAGATLLTPAPCPRMGTLVICDLGQMAPGATNQVAIQVTPNVGGVTLVAGARVLFAGDTNLANNSESVSATVTGPGFRRVWSASAGTTQTLAMIDPDVDAVTGVVQLNSPAFDVALSPDGTRAYAVQSNANNVVVLDARINRGNPVIANIPVGAPVRAKVHPDGSRLYVTHGAAEVSVFDTTTFSLIKTIPVGGAPNGMTFVANALFVANRNGDSVSYIDTTTDTVDDTIFLPTGSFPVDVAAAPDARALYITNYFGNNVTVVDPIDNSIVTTIPVGTGPQGVAVSPDSKFAYVANFEDDTVSVIDTATNAVIATPVVPGSPNGILVSPDGDRYFVTSYNSGQVYVLRTTTNTIIGSVAVGGFPVTVDYARLP